MLSLADIRQYIADTGITEDSRVFIGKLDNKKEKSIGVYQRPSQGNARVPLGGMQNASYGEKKISLLVHWNRVKTESEETAFLLYDMLQKEGRVRIGNTDIRFIRLAVPEPQDVGTDDNGVYEYVVWTDFIYERKKEDT